MAGTVLFANGTAIAIPRRAKTGVSFTPPSAHENPEFPNKIEPFALAITLFLARLHV
jgi:hypothetical protein